MRPNQLKSLTMFASAFALSLGVSALADDGHKHGAPLHGGKVAMTTEYHFEVVFAKDGLKVYPRSHEDEPLDASRLAGTATFYHPNSPKPWFERKLAAPPASPGRAASSLGTTIDLSKVPPTGAKVAFRIEGLPEAAEPTATFTVPFAAPATSGAIVVAKATTADEKAIAAQKVCPVSREDLFAMGGPLKVSRGDKSLFICCKGCLKELHAHPEKFLGASAAEAKHEHSGH